MAHIFLPGYHSQHAATLESHQPLQARMWSAVIDVIFSDGLPKQPTPLIRSPHIVTKVPTLRHNLRILKSGVAYYCS